MEDSTNHAKFCFADGRIELEGSEGFVAAQIIKLESLLSKLVEQLCKSGTPPDGGVEGASESPASINGKHTGSTSSVSDGKFVSYANVFALADNKTQIIKDVPGTTKAKKAVDVAMLLAFGNELRGIKPTSMDEIRANCTTHVCLDSSNFAAHMKSSAARQVYTISGKGVSQTITLTQPGKVKAKELADLLNK
ncbi:hypothetical protein [Paralcaligenes ureilyticus]|uniref:Uncharacterized protein n=1 Tax=Paralcaligenes ureilyticus TaxID=627131 RepID=A0A4R3MBT9_9BURK|nr:hypothetical protein [Paralcaligenes ureilyticus]TCT10826.1 hypothetical protein EDC26_10145 [Paralcaligenes ureilyticus]